MPKIVVPTIFPNDKLGRNESCWCGSGKKFKKCHLNRHAEEKVDPQAAIIDALAFFEKNTALILGHLKKCAQQ